MKFQTFDSPVSIEAAWNRLCQQSIGAIPPLRARLAEQWCGTFAQQTARQVAVVEDQGELQAGLFLLQQRLKKIVTAGMLPANEWSISGDLIAQPNCSDEAYDCLVAGLRRQPYQVLLLEHINLALPQWQRFLAAVDRAGLPWIDTVSCVSGEVLLNGSWEDYFAGRSKGHRQQMRKAQKSATALGNLELRMLRELSPDEVAHWLYIGFEIEDQGWKGKQTHSSVFQSPGIYEFYLQQAQLLAASGQLCLTFLMLDERPIAFEYAWELNGVYYTPKVSYDENYGHLSPGQLLRHLLFQQLFASGQHHKLDFFGPLSLATGKWANSSYRVSRLLIGTSPVIGRLAVQAAKLWRSRPGKRSGKRIDAQPGND